VKSPFRIIVIVLLVMVMASLACNASSTPTTAPNSDLMNTQVAMAMTQTALSKPPDQIDLPDTPTQGTGLVSTQVAMAMTQTAMANPPVLPTNTIAPPPPEPTATPKPTEVDLKGLMNSANILTYEDMIDYPQYITIVSKALKTFNGHKVYVGDAIGTLMDQLNSGTDWDLIIIAAEARGAISGDYWDVIKDRVDDGAALIVEIWYLDDIGAGKIAPLLYQCGVEVQDDWYRVPGDDRLKYDMYWSQANSPVFNTPNKVTRFAASLTTPAWNGDIGDLMRLRPGSDATLLASHAAGEGQTSYGLITSCLGGNMILQTFDSHDYPTDPMVALWQNYITYTLTNHFKNR
jgi:hypothetical protein